VHLGQRCPPATHGAAATQHEVIQAARQRQEIAEFKAQYARWAGIEGTHTQAIQRCGLRQCLYIGQGKTHLEHLCTAVALNVVRLGAWWLGTPKANTGYSPFAALRVAVAYGSLSDECATSINAGWFGESITC
jgi:Transposase DDE domain